jgi:hypothetical protein
MIYSKNVVTFVYDSGSLRQILSGASEACYFFWRNALLHVYWERNPTTWLAFSYSYCDLHMLQQKHRRQNSAILKAADSGGDAQFSFSVWTIQQSISMKLITASIREFKN